MSNNDRSAQAAPAVGSPVDRGVMQRRTRPVIGARPTDGGPVEWHADGGQGNDYALCGLGIDGDLYEPVRGNRRITCQQCRSIWLAARSVRAVDFAA